MRREDLIVSCLCRLFSFHRGVCSQRTSLTLPSMSTGTAVLNVQAPFQLTVLRALSMWKGSGNLNPHRVRHIEGHCNNIHKDKVQSRILGQ